jgi:hypothetical protein
MEAKIFTNVEWKTTEGPAGKREVCPEAQDFLKWAQDLCSEYCDTTIRIAQAKVLLIDKYEEFRRSVPKECRHHAAEEGHFCIWHVAFEYAYRHLRQAELRLTPPMLFLPTPPPPKQVPQVQGIWVGEEIS